MRRKTRLLVYGAGGHGSVVLDAALSSSDFDVIGLLEDDSSLHGKAILGVEVLGGIELLGKDALSGAAIIVAIGDAKRREEVVGRVERLGHGGRRPGRDQGRRGPCPQDYGERVR